MGWLADILLESPAPPPNYLPGRRARLGMARATLRGGSPLRRLVRSHGLRDLGSAHPLIGGSRVIPAETIASELEADIRSINPPVTQGWMVGALVLAVLCGLPGLQAFVTAPDGRAAIAGAARLALPMAIACAMIAIGSLAISGLELRGDRVILRSWLGARLGRPGRDLGPADSLRARQVGRTLILTGPAGRAKLSLRGWPPSAYQDVIDELPIWGVRAPFGPHPSRRAERDRRREQSLERRRAEQEKHHHRR